MEEVSRSWSLNECRGVNAESHSLNMDYSKRYVPAGGDWISATLTWEDVTSVTVGAPLMLYVDRNDEENDEDSTKEEDRIACRDGHGIMKVSV